MISAHRAHKGRAATRRKVCAAALYERYRRCRSHSGSNPIRFRMKCNSVNSVTISLFHVLKCREVLFAGADLDDLRYVVDKDLAISDVTGIQSLLRCRDDLFYRNL